MNVKEAGLASLFVEMVRKLKAPVVFELGTKQSVPGRSTMHREWAPHAVDFIGIDFEEGADVDYVADAQYLSRDLSKYPRQRCDAFISCSTFEHIKNPFLAATEICHVVRPGGLIFVQTHHTFPLHAYPYDYWRYTVDSLTHIFTRPGVEIVDAAYQYPANILAAQEPNARNFPAYLNVCLVARKRTDVDAPDVTLFEKVFDGLKEEVLSSKLASDVGELCFSIGLRERAHGFFEKALSIDPMNSLALNNMGVARFHSGEVEAARRYFRDALKSDPGNVDAAANLSALSDTPDNPGGGIGL